LAVTVFTAWVVAVVFAFSWYRKWGGWSSNAFAVTVILCVTLPVFLAIWLGSGYSPDEHLKRLLRSRVVILSLTVRGLMLLHLVAVLTIVGIYATELRGYPRTTAGWLMVPTTLTMASTTFLTTWFHRRSLRHVWLVVAMGVEQFFQVAADHVHHVGQAVAAPPGCSSRLRINQPVEDRRQQALLGRNARHGRSNAPVGCRTLPPLGQGVMTTASRQ
jgi:hypothetical protein